MTFGTIVAFPFGRLDMARSRRCQLALDQIVRGTGPPLPSLALSGRLQLLVGNFRFWFRICCFSWNYTSNVFATFSPTCS